MPSNQREQSTYILLHTRKLNDAFIDHALGNETIDGHLASLTQTVCTVHGLGIIGRVPVMVVEYHSVRSGKVDTETTSTSTEQEYEYVWSGNEIKPAEHTTHKTRTLFANPSPYPFGLRVSRIHPDVDTCIVDISDILPSNPSCESSGSRSRLDDPLP